MGFEAGAGAGSGSQVQEVVHGIQVLVLKPHNLVQQSGPQLLQHCHYQVPKPVCRSDDGAPQDGQNVFRHQAAHKPLNMRRRPNHSHPIDNAVSSNILKMYIYIYIYRIGYSYVLMVIITLLWGAPCHHMPSYAIYVLARRTRTQKDDCGT